MRRLAQTFSVAVIALSMLVGCATVGPPQPPSLKLPQSPTDLRGERKGNRVILIWSIPTMTTDRETVRTLGPTLICRATGELTACNQPVEATNTPISPGKVGIRKQQTSYTDTLPQQLISDDPAGFVSYAVQVLNGDGRAAGLSNHVRVSLIRTLPPPRDFRATVAKEGVVLNWTGEIVSTVPQGMQYFYRVYRRVEGSNESVVAAETPAGTQSSFTITDASIEWQGSYYYSAESVTRIQQPRQVEVPGDDTPEVKVFADDVFPPAVPSGLQAVFSGPGQKPFIDLVWAPVTEVDLAGYNVYRREEGTSPVKLNGELVKAPAYRDEHVVSGSKYFYSVSAVDLRGNESARSEETSEAVPSGGVSIEQ
jgi:hypothetical protein